MFLFVRNMFKFLGHNQFLQISEALKKIVLFHDHGFILLRFAILTNHSLVAYIVVYCWLKTRTLLGLADYVVLTQVIVSFSWSFFACSLDHEFWSIFSNISSHLSSNICNEVKAHKSFRSSGRIILVFDISKLHNFVWTCCFKFLYYSSSSDFIHKLQAVYNRKDEHSEETQSLCCKMCIP